MAFSFNKMKNYPVHPVI